MSRASSGPVVIITPVSKINNGVYDIVSGMKFAVEADNIRDAIAKVWPKHCAYRTFLVHVPGVGNFDTIIELSKEGAACSDSTESAGSASGQ